MRPDDDDAARDLAAGGDHLQTRARILRYTAPASLAGLPVVTLPGRACGLQSADGLQSACGLQLVGRLGSDAELLALSAELSHLSG